MAATLEQNTTLCVIDFFQLDFYVFKLQTNFQNIVTIVYWDINV